MREIKFKVWDIDNKKWYHSTQLVIRPYSGNVTDGATTPNVILLQYTGMKDKNGTEIYEGDVIKSVSELYSNYGKNPTGRYETTYYEIVTNTEDSYCFGKREIGSEYITKTIYKDIAIKYYEIIGNIYSNPELLEV